MKPLILIVAIFAASPLCFSQSMLMNGKEVDRSQRITMDSTSKILIHGVQEDSVYIDVIHARGVRGMGQKAFLTVTAFNQFDLWRWLKSEYHDLSKSMDKTGESPGKIAVKKGDRIVVILYRKGSPVNSWEVFIE